MMPLPEPLHALHTELGIPPDYATARKLLPMPEANTLTPLGLDGLGRDAFATADTAAAWRAMQTAAMSDGVSLILVSAFRSVAYQAGLIRRKLAQGQTIDAILEVSAAPGFSEHHTGRALDLGTAGEPMLETSFETTPAFQWLSLRAGDFGFRLSYPHGNPHGIAYEPWHWYFAAHAVAGDES
jgi:D-alanyl-D-alanine carboxypeptidase